MTIEPATIKDTRAIVSIFIANKNEVGLFQQSEVEVRSSLKDFLVARDAGGTAVACLGIHRDSFELAEIYGARFYQNFKARESAQCSCRDMWSERLLPS